MDIDAHRTRRARARLTADWLGISPGLFGATVVVGIFGGGLGALYLLVMHTMQRYLGPQRWSDGVSFAILGGTGLVVALMIKFIGTPGDVELLVDNIHVSGGPSNIRTLRTLVPASLLTISVGGAAGPEAPLVTTTGSLAAWFARKRRESVTDTRILTIAGMAAAFTVLFGAPLGSSLFALEILHRRGLQYHEALVPAIVGSLTGYGMYTLLTRADLTPVWDVTRAGGGDIIRPIDLLLALGAGVLGAVIATVFTYLVILMRRVFGQLPVFARPIVGGLALASLGLWSPYALTFGEAQTKHVLSADLLVGALLVALFAKLIGTSVTVSSGWPGGFIIPLFFIGATLGRICDAAFPNSHGAVLAGALMAAACVGVTKTLLGSTLVVTEMGGLHLLPTTLIAATVAFLLTNTVGLIETQRERVDLSEDDIDDEPPDDNTLAEPA